MLYAHRTRSLCLCRLSVGGVCLFKVFLGELEVVEGLDQRLEVVERLEGQGKEGLDLQQEVGQHHSNSFCIRRL